MGYNIAIDGPSGAGKSSISRALAAKLGFIYVDTGAMYRAVGLYAQRHGVDPSDAAGVCALLPGIDIGIEHGAHGQRIYLCGENVSEAIREHIISSYASQVSAHTCVREFLLGLQKRLAAENDVVMDGRDIGTVVLPHAFLKIFMTASPQVRARRRYNELVAKGGDIRYETVLCDMLARDERDTNRKISPTIAAEDAVVFDNGEYNIEQSVDYIIALFREKQEK